MAIEIEKRLPVHALLYPSHLIYALSGDWLYRFSNALGIHTRALFLLQTANGVLAGLCVLLFYQILKQKGASRWWSTIAALTFGFSATWWKFATDANAYIPSICLMLYAYLLLSNPRWTFAAGLAHAGAMLFHELAILFVPVLLLKLSKRRRDTAIYLLGAFAPVAAAYWLAYRNVIPDATLAGLFPWLTVHSPDSGFSFRLGNDLILTLRGTLRLFFGGKLAELPAGFAFKLLLIVLAGTAAAFFFFLSRAVQRVKLQRPPLQMAVWAGVYVAFLFFWMPQNTFYRLFYLPPLIALIAIAIRETQEIRLTGLLLAAFVLLWNFTFFVYPQSRIEPNAPLRFALAQQGKWAVGSAIVFHDFGPDLWTISYFNSQAAWIALERPDIAELNRDLQYASAQRQALWLEASAYDLISNDARGRQWLTQHDRPGELIEFHDGKHEFRFHCAR